MSQSLTTQTKSLEEAIWRSETAQTLSPFVSEGHPVTQNAAGRFLVSYFQEYQRLAFELETHASIQAFARLAARVRDSGGKLMLAGNGASASASEHGAVDFTKQGKVRAITFHDPNLITCFANDYGYDNWIAKAIEHYSNPEDAVVLISVSGTSPSVVNAAKYARSVGLPVTSFTGRKPDNQLKQLSDIAFFVASDAYNVVECIHCIWLTATIDLLIGSSVYETRSIPLS
jgi:D-sedoheptulose 7-phosphate isomerase